MSEIQYNYAPSFMIGTTGTGLTRPVFYDTHSAVFNSKPPCTVVFGGPGSGKTFLAMTLTCMSAIAGKPTVVIDPKGDFLPLINMEDELGNLRIWNLSDTSKKGILDPFSMEDTRGEKVSLAISVIETFTGGLRDSQRSALIPIVQDVAAEPDPSLSRVVRALRASPKDEARDLGNLLNVIQDMPYAKLAFAPGRATAASDFGVGLTIITMPGMNLPASPEEAARNQEGRLVSGILFLLTNFIQKQFLKDLSRTPKTLIIDEAWALIATEAGAGVINSISLLGRSLNAAVVLITQSPHHLDNLNIENTISTVFSFRSSVQESRRVAQDIMSLPSDLHIEEEMAAFEAGQCLMQDWRKRYSVVQISNWNTRWNESFETNPLARLRERSRVK